MIRSVLLCFSLLLCFSCATAQVACFSRRTDSLLGMRSPQSFNGIILLHRDGHTLYRRTAGYANLSKQVSLKADDQFIIGSISKQMTAVLILRELDKGHLHLDSPIRKYLKTLSQPWSDTVTVHQLLTHTHGITGLDQPLAFRPGTQFAYSMIGYELLARIAAAVSGKSFIVLSQELFRYCGMKHSFHPAIQPHHRLVTAYMEQADGTLLADSTGLKTPAPAGGFISTAADLVRWNECLHQGRLLQKNTYALMMTPQPNAIRQHPLFGLTHYGLGITTGTFGDALQLGQTGLTTGFASMNFYYPGTKTSLIILENVVYDPDYLRQTFYHHSAIREFLRECQLLQPGP